ncbi:MAG: TonB-dependent receptor [Bacteroidaceae bacterium]|nr:TonB-dependent receptor [Bacteroidaceae bacterium]
MKHLFTHIILLLLAVCHAKAQTVVSGVVTDGNDPLVGTNVYIEGTIDGCLADSLGHFSFTTYATGEVTLRSAFIGYEDYTLTTNVSQLSGITILMSERACSINEVVVTASTYSFGKGNNFKTMDALDVVMTGNSCGDIVAALQTLPGTQKVGEDGKLYVRGGESEECQTFINGMHVLVPYTTHTENTAVRGRFSPFLFKGINFSLGGYNGEYGQALSAVLPMETTDAVTSDKMGVSASLVDWNLGGTKAYQHSSLSFNAALTSMGLYERLFHGRDSFSSPYRKLSCESQYKAELNKGVIKTYVGYDLSTAGQLIDDRNLTLKEHNVYANATYKASMGHGYTFFAGMANSSVISHIDDARKAGDHYYDFRNEVHLKAEVQKSCNDVLKLSAGAESYIRHSNMQYDDYGYQLNYNLLAAHMDAQWRIIPHLFLNMSARAEQMHSNWTLMPRATLSYIPNKNWQVSLITGRYSQTIADEYLAYTPHGAGQSTADHAIASVQYKSQGTLLRIESYWKRYHQLPLWQEGTYRLHGFGSSKGVDVFLENHSLLRNLTTTFSYSLNFSERLYLDYSELCTPHYASRHNFRLTAKYAIGKVNIGVADTYASGRHFATGTTPPLHSVDLNLTYLLSPKIIIYSSLSNILGRTNIVRYEADGKPVHLSRDRFLYIGIFVSLKNNKAYDISNF